jgi:hypothetical protein
MELAMNAISTVFIHSIPETSTEIHPLRAIVLFCCLGLVASLCLAISGFDLGAGLI